MRNNFFELTQDLLSSKQSMTRIPLVPRRVADDDGLSSGDNQTVKGVIDNLYNRGNLLVIWYVYKITNTAIGMWKYRMKRFHF